MKKIYLTTAFLLISLIAFSQTPARHTNGVVIGGGPTDGTGLKAGQLKWDSDDLKFRKYNGTIWSDLIAANANIFESELTDAQNNIDVGFNLTATTLIYFNGKLVENARWSGEGTQILNLSLDTKLYDNLSVKN